MIWKSVSVSAATVATISVLGTMKATSCVANAPLMDTTSVMSNVLSTGVDDGRKIENGIKIKLL